MKTLRFLAVAALAVVAFGSLGTMARADYTSTTLALNPLGYWPLNEAAGTSAANLGAFPQVGTHHDVTVGTPGIAGQTPALSATYAGTSSSYTSVQANNVYSPGAIDSFGPANTGMTYEIWEKGAAQDANAFYWYDQASGLDLYSLSVDHNGKANSYVRDSNGNGAGLTSTAVVGDNQWHMLAVTFGFAPVTATPFENLYVDGVLQGTTTIAGFGAFTAAGPLLAFGAHPLDQSSPFAGSLDGAAIFGTVLAPTDILNQYVAGVPSVPEPSSIVLALGGFAAFFVVRRFRRRSEG